MKGTENHIKIAGLLLLATLLSGCQENSMNDLKRFVDTAHKGKKPKIEPLPTIKPIEGYTYSAQTSPDPFNRQNLKPRRVVASQSGTGPDKNRRREPLENYPLDSLTMVGSLFREGDTRVIIKTPRGAVQTATVGNYMGQNYGKIISITEREVKVKEHVLNSSGMWIEREATIKVK
jgi:type IV pilus assembly protein PilP